MNSATNFREALSFGHDTTPVPWPDTYSVDIASVYVLKYDEIHKLYEVVRFVYVLAPEIQISRKIYENNPNSTKSS